MAHFYMGYVVEDHSGVLKRTHRRVLAASKTEPGYRDYDLEDFPHQDLLLGWPEGKIFWNEQRNFGLAPMGATV